MLPFVCADARPTAKSSRARRRRAIAGSGLQPRSKQHCSALCAMQKRFMHSARVARRVRAGQPGLS